MRALEEELHALRQKTAEERLRRKVRHRFQVMCVFQEFLERWEKISRHVEELAPDMRRFYKIMKKKCKRAAEKRREDPRIATLKEALLDVLHVFLRSSPQSWAPRDGVEVLNAVRLAADADEDIRNLHNRLLHIYTRYTSGSRQRPTIRIDRGRSGRQQQPCSS